MAVSYGIILITLKGTYDATVQYDTLNVVELDGSSYICKSKPPTVGVPPTNTTYWQLLTRGVDSSFSIDDLADVDIDFTTIQDKQAIVWDAVNNCFVAGNVADASVIAFPDVSPAESAHATGTYLYYNDTTYEVIDDIAIGDTLTIGTNIDVPTLDEGTVIYIPETAGGGSGTAADTSYDNTTSGLSATNVQDALDEVVDMIPSGGGSNRNLLYNPWFKVNQRGSSSYNSANVQTNVYTVDRWYIFNATLNVASNGITLTHNSNTNWGAVNQVIEENLVGKTVTLSIMYSNGVIHSQSGVATDGGSIRVYFADNWNTSVYFSTSNTSVEFRGKTSDSTLTVKAVKLELGSVSTLALDTEPNYIDELNRCKYFYYRVDNSRWNTANGIGDVRAHSDTTRGIIDISGLNMRLLHPTVRYNNISINGVAVSSASCNSVLNDTQVMFYTTSGNLTAGLSYGILAPDNTSYYELDAEIY